MLIILAGWIGVSLAIAGHVIFRRDNVTTPVIPVVPSTYVIPRYANVTTWDQAQVIISDDGQPVIVSTMGAN
jgi:hypothetical protein